MELYKKKVQKAISTIASVLSILKLGNGCSSISRRCKILDFFENSHFLMKIFPTQHFFDGKLLDLLDFHWFAFVFPLISLYKHKGKSMEIQQIRKFPSKKCWVENIFIKKCEFSKKSKMFHLLDMLKHPFPCFKIDNTDAMVEIAFGTLFFV